MTTVLPSAMSRLAAPAEGISTDELALAGRNNSLLLETMRHDLTPPGLHYRNTQGMSNNGVQRPGPRALTTWGEMCTSRAV